MKKCARCDKIKSVTEFNSNHRKKDGLQAYCRDCTKEYYSKYYKSNPNEKTRLRGRRKEFVREFQELLKKEKDKPCMDCGKKYPYYVMDFDHRDPADKVGTIALNGNWWSLEQVRVEIEKCDVVCSNCHRERTHKHRLTSVEELVDSSGFGPEVL